MNSQFCLIGLVRPGPERTPSLGKNDSFLLTRATLYDETHVFGILANGTRKDDSLRIWPAMKPDGSGHYHLELAVVLPDLLPTVAGKIDYALNAQTSSHSTGILRLSNQMVRVNCYRGDKLSHIILPEPAVTQLHEHGIQVSSKPPYEILRTMAAMTFTLPASSVDDALERYVEKCATALAAALNDFMSAYAMVESDLFSAQSTAFDSRSFDILYFALHGAEEKQRQVGRIALHSGKAILNPQDLSGAQLDEFRKYWDGSATSDPVRLMFTSAKNSFHSGQLSAALLQIVITAEMALAAFIREEYQRAGVSRTKWNEMKRDLRYSHMLNLHLFAFAPDQAKPDQEMLAALNRARTLRNEFMHEGAFTADRPTIDGFVTATEAFLRYLADLKRTKRASPDLPTNSI